MTFVLIILGLTIVALSLSIQGRRALPAVCAIGIVSVVAPIFSVAAYGFDSSESASAYGILFAAGFGMATVGCPPARAENCVESELASVPRCKGMFAVLAAVTLLAQVVMLLQISDGFVISSLYDLNVAYSSDEVPSFGIWGRLNRLAIPGGVIAALFAVLLGDRRERLYFAAMAAIFLVALMGPRRSLVFYQVVTYGFAYLIVRMRRGGVSLRATLGGFGLAVGLISFFGYIQVATRKATADSLWLAALRDGTRYISGNLPYGDCVLSSAHVGRDWSAFPGIAKTLGQDPGAGTKPFCVLPDGSLLNTSPGYLDVALEFGFGAALLWGLLLGFIVVWSARGSYPSIGVQALILTAVTFQFRENVFGQLDYLQAVLVLMAAAAYGRALIRRRHRRSESVRWQVA